MTVYRIPKRRYAYLPDTLFDDDTTELPSECLEPILGCATASGKPVQFDAKLLVELFNDMGERDDGNADLDIWLAPRLHSAIRAPRRIAADAGFWSWLAFKYGRSYLKRRFGDNTGTVPRWRFTGPFQRNGLSRLWWGAEMARRGSDYSEVGVVFSRVRTAQFALELQYSWYRPAAIAFGRVAEGKDGGALLNDDAMSALSRTINAYLSLTSLEALALQDEPENPCDHTWWDSSPTLEELRAKSIEGPDDGRVADDSLDRLTRWFRGLADQVAANEAA